MTTEDRNIDKLVRSYLHEHEQKVNAPAFLARVKAAKPAKRRRPALRLAAAASIAAGLAIVSLHLFRNESAQQPPELPPISELVQDQGKAALTGAAAGVAAAQHSFQEAAAHVSMQTAPLLTQNLNIPAPSLDTQLDSLRRDAGVIGQNIRSLIYRTLSDAGLQS